MNYQETRMACLEHYSGPHPVCACCGVDVVKALQLHHIDGGGSIQRRKIHGGDHGMLTSGGPEYSLSSNTSLSDYFRDIIARGFEDNMMVLCANCHLCVEDFGPSFYICLLHPTSLIKKDDSTRHDRRSISRGLWES